MTASFATEEVAASRAGARIVSPAPRSEWEEVLAADPNAVVSQTPAWTDFLCAFGAYRDTSRLYELAGGRRLVLPMVAARRLPERLRVEGSFPPSWGMGGIVAPGGVTSEDVTAVFDDLAACLALRISIRPNPLDAEAWRSARPEGVVAVPRLAHVLSLEGGFEQVWTDRFAGTARTAVRKAERSGLEVERDTSGRLVPVLYELFERSLERWARQQHEPPALARWRGRRRDPVRKFELMARTLGEACRIWVARKDGRAVAAILVLQGENAHYTRGVMDKDLAGPTRANYLLHKLAIEDACAAGCRSYQMGETGPSASLAQFKTRFGALPYAYAEYHLERIPITALDRRARSVVKRVVGFRD